MKKKIGIFLIVLFAIIVIPVKSKAITIVLDPGHGGHDGGAVDKAHDINEKDINLKIAKYLKEYLDEYKDTKIILTRSDDTFLEIYDRSMIARNNNADLIISLHMNSTASGSAEGAEIYVSNNTSLPKYKEETSKLSEKILANLNKLGIKNRGVLTRLIPTDVTDVYSDETRADYYGIIRYAMRGCRIDSGVIKPAGAVPANVQNGEGVPAIIIEHCYLSSPNDYKFYSSDEEIKKLAKADADAIIEHYNLSKVEKEKFKIKDKYLFTNPEINISEIKEKYPSANLILEENDIATNKKITIDDTEYNIIVLGDCNNDGKITPADYVKIKNHIMDVSKLEEIEGIAADANEDGAITPADYVIIKNHIMDVKKIQIKTEEK